MAWGVFPLESYNIGFMRSRGYAAVPGSLPCWFPFADWWLCCPWGAGFELLGHISASWCHMHSSLPDWHTCWSPSEERNTTINLHTRLATQKFALNPLAALIHQQTAVKCCIMSLYFSYFQQECEWCSYRDTRQTRFKVSVSCQPWLHCTLET